MAVVLNLEEQVTENLRNALKTGQVVHKAVEDELERLTEDEKDELLEPVLIQKAERLAADIQITRIHPGFTPSPKTTGVPVTPSDNSKTIERGLVRNKEREALKQYTEARLPSERATAFIQVASQKFTTKGVEYPWNRAETNAHESKASELSSQAKGHLESAKLHNWAIDEIKKTPGAKTLQDVLDYYFNPLGNSAGYKVA